ncbi:hypothetical protein [Beggiatoa leptomitoformis]|uniref:Uncharacterized protein n=1 Tax=Beggiatoa leptomitoformis TaxID=288004 RepID=A0A2N9YG54_9GAMM|nr:hypothetical protein [Beggiatoa leptomitoformis]ALG68231.1 hypothetical protein AL038_11570 [Beggiatoa leptomitoformis]AUI69463.1 hypothetical protein BLE401_12705 [Beggiatoa leptomitoformis]
MKKQFKALTQEEYKLWWRFYRVAEKASTRQVHGYPSDISANLKGIYLKRRHEYWSKTMLYKRSIAGRPF